MKEENKEKKKTKNKVNRKKIVMYIVLALVIMYLVYAVYLLVKQPTDKVTVENGTLYLEETDIGYIIRDEQVVKGNNYKNGMERIMSIEGMMCTHCSGRVESVLNALPGVRAKVDLEKKIAVISAGAEVTNDALRKAVEDAGYTVKEIR